MSDLFHEGVPTEFIKRVFEVMTFAEHHTFQVLTKRSTRLAALADDLTWPKNVWVGVSLENQRWVTRVDDLNKVRDASVRFLSCEPLLGPIALNLEGIDWVIAGGESGPKARIMKVAWVRSIRDQCNAASVPFFFKQWGAHNAEGKSTSKKSAGRVLDGRVWSEMPGLSDTDQAKQSAKLA